MTCRTTALKYGLTVLLSAFFLAGCLDSSGGSDDTPESGDIADGNDDNDSSGADDNGGGDSSSDEDADNQSTEVSLQPMAAEVQGIDIADRSDLWLKSFGDPAINQQGDVTFNANLSEPDASGLPDTISGGKSYFKLAPDTSEPEAYLSLLLPLDDFPGFDYSGSVRQGPAADGSVSALIELENGTGTSMAAAVRYQDGDYEVLAEDDDIPGLSGYSLEADDLLSNDAFASDPDGNLVIRLPLRDAEGDKTWAWWRVTEAASEAVMIWGDDTGEEYIDGRSYLFQWPFLSASSSRPVITADGTTHFFARGRTDEDSNGDAENLAAFWSVGLASTTPVIDLRTDEDFTDQSGTGEASLSDIAPDDAGYSINDDSHLALLSELSGDRDLWLRNDSGYWSIALEGDSAPNWADMPSSSGGSFTYIGLPTLNNRGELAFYAEVEDRTSLWRATEQGARPIVAEGMTIPGYDQFEVVQVGLKSSPPEPAPFMNNEGQLVFWAEVIDTETGDRLDSLWLHDRCDQFRLIASEGQEVSLTGLPVLESWEENEPVFAPAGEATRVIDSINRPQFSRGDRGVGPNSGVPRPLNDNGQFAFIAELEGDYLTTFSSVEPGDTGTLKQEVLLMAQFPTCEP
ncbi:MAG: hypothetical protein R6U69_03640 [Marinobacter sp.]|uniref:DUF7453 family protein n=1 Tax=Marinobacter sp. TaxID=50741 RepID=UPI00356A15A7